MGPGTILWEFPLRVGVTGQAGIKIFKYWPLLISSIHGGQYFNISAWSLHSISHPTAHSIVRCLGFHIFLWLVAFIGREREEGGSLRMTIVTLMKNYAFHIWSKQGLWQWPMQGGTWDSEMWTGPSSGQGKDHHWSSLNFTNPCFPPTTK